MLSPFGEFTKVRQVPATQKISQLRETGIPAPKSGSQQCGEKGIPRKGRGLRASRAGFSLCVADVYVDGWGGWIRTNEWRYQKPLPYRLATPQCLRIGRQTIQESGEKQGQNKAIDRWLLHLFKARH